jgi:hypothetical protein
MRPSIAEAARFQIFRDTIATSFAFECAWAAVWSEAAQQVVDVELIGRGSRTTAPAFGYDLRPNEMLLHSHPSGSVEPSDADIQCAIQIGANGHGFGICNNDGTVLYVVRQPRPPRILQHAGASSAWRRVFRLGPYELLLSRRPTP